MDIQEDIRKQLQAGFTQQEIKQNLANNGHSKEEIDKAYKEVMKNTIVQESSDGKSTARTIISIVIFIIIVIRWFIRCSNMNY